MRQTFEEYYREMVESAESFSQLEEMRRQEDHLRSFNLGRIAGRFQDSKPSARLRAGWLLAGLLIGIACGRFFPNHLYHTVAGRFLTHTRTVAETAKKTAAR
jgi:hypothetical protein